MSQVACPHCQAVVDATGFAPGTQVACGLCGGVMTVGGAPARAPGGRMVRGPVAPRRRGSSPTERLQLPREVQRARSAITAIQILYAVFAVLSAIPSVILFLMVSASGALGNPLALVMLAVFFGVTALYVVGALMIYRQPMLWSILIAVLQTLVALFGLRDGLSLADFVAIGIAAGCWVAVGVISSAGRTLHRYSDEGARQAAMADRRRSRAATRRTHRRMA